MSMITLRTSLRLACTAAVITVLGISAVAQFSSGGLTAQIPGDPNTTGSGTLLYTHTYPGNTCSSVPGAGASIPATSSFSCTGSIAPSAPTPATGSVNASDAIAYRGTAAAAQVTEQVSAPSCAPIQLADSVGTANPLLARYGTTFAPSVGPRTGMGAITVDGASPGGYETAVTQQSFTIPSASLFGTAATYGYGVWFNAATGSAGGPLFGFGDSPANTAGTNDRILTLTSAGKLAFVATTTGTTLTQSTATDYRGAWHFAYVLVTATNYSFSTDTLDASISVDGTTIASGDSLTGGPASYNGYWHVGWSPISGVSKYFAGSVSNFVVFASAPAPNPPTSTNLASQSSFDSWSSTATERYRLNDTGTATYTGTLPGGAANPCTTVNMSWGFASPVSCGYAPTSSTAACTSPPAGSLASFATGTARGIASPAPGTTQTSTVTTTRGSAYNTAFAPGLHLFAPLTFTATSGGWVNSFTWNTAASAFIA